MGLQSQPKNPHRINDASFSKPLVPPPDTLCGYEFFFYLHQNFLFPKPPSPTFLILICKRLPPFSAIFNLSNHRIFPLLHPLLFLSVVVSPSIGLLAIPTNELSAFPLPPRTCTPPSQPSSSPTMDTHNEVMLLFFFCLLCDHFSFDSSIVESPSLFSPLPCNPSSPPFLFFCFY